MATVRISVDTPSGRYEVEREYPETMEQAYGPDKSHLDQLVDSVVRDVKRSYGGGAR